MIPDLVDKPIALDAVTSHAIHATGPDAVMIALEPLLQALNTAIDDLDKEHFTHPETKTFWSLPSAQQTVRWLIPQSPRYGLRVLKDWRPYNVFTQLKWKGFQTAYHHLPPRWMQRLPGVQSLSINYPQAIWSNIVSTESPPHTQPVQWVPVIYIGTRCNVQKAIVTLVHPDTAEPSWVVKIPLGNQAALRIQDEVTALNALNQKGFLGCPKAVSRHPKLGWSCQRYEAGGLLDATLTSAHLSFLRQLKHPHETITLNDAAQATLKHLAQFKDTYKNTDENTGTVADFDYFQQQLSAFGDNNPLPAVRLHGDFVPWNLKHTAIGSIMALDWESSREKGLPLYDLAHYHLMLAYAQGQPAEQFWSMLDHPMVQSYCETFQIPTALARQIMGLYCINHGIHHRLNGDFDYARRYDDYIRPLFQ